MCEIQCLIMPMTKVCLATNLNVMKLIFVAGETYILFLLFFFLPAAGQFRHSNGDSPILCVPPDSIQDHQFHGCGTCLDWHPLAGPGRPPGIQGQQRWVPITYSSTSMFRSPHPNR